MKPLKAAQVYYNYTGGMDCLDLGGGGDAPDLGYDAWYYQTCTEFVMPFCADGKQDMFLPSEFNFDDYKQNCINTFGTYPRKGTLHKIMETLKIRAEYS